MTTMTTDLSFLSAVSFYYSASWHVAIGMFQEKSMAGGLAHAFLIRHAGAHRCSHRSYPDIPATEAPGGMTKSGPLLRIQAAAPRKSSTIRLYSPLRVFENACPPPSGITSLAPGIARASASE